MCLFLREFVFLIALISINLVLTEDSDKYEQELKSWKCELKGLPYCPSTKQCVESPLLCDGLKDCPEGVDETEKQCAKNNCTANEFRCSYGACISLSGKCDGRTDCADNSDETNADCPPITNEVDTINYCNSNQFQCLLSKNCIDKQLLCDGKGDCDDNSDETPDQCQYNICPSSKFRCEYGACINASEMCNGKIDCFDGSDEFQKQCEVIVYHVYNPNLPPPKFCQLPDNSNNYHMKFNSSKENPRGYTASGRNITWNTELIYRCKKGYKTVENGDEFFSACFKGQWLPDINKCLRLCKVLKPENVELTCIFKGKKVDCKGPMMEGTSVRPKCKPHHNPAQEVHYKTIHCESNGRWTKELYKCVQDCGKPVANATKLKAQASKEEYGNAPWYVAVFDVKTSNRQLICGGTLILPYLVVSAAHCFFDEINQRLRNVNDYEIAVSKFTPQYSKQDNRFTKKYKIREIILPDKIYTGDSTKYVSDIAILWIRDKISLNQAVMPACVDWTGSNKFNPEDGSRLGLTGLGQTEQGKLREFRRTAQLPFISRNKCINTLPIDFKDIVTLDKFCAGSDKGSGPGQGDSGGGLLLRDQRLGAYFLRGIVSVKGASSSQVALFTNINSYLDWMRQVRARVQKFIK